MTTDPTHPSSPQTQSEGSPMSAWDQYRSDVFHLLCGNSQPEFSVEREQQAARHERQDVEQRIPRAPDDGKKAKLNDAFVPEGTHDQHVAGSQLSRIGSPEGSGAAGVDAQLFERMGLSALAAVWPRDGMARLVRLAREAEAIELIWDSTGSGIRADDSSGEVARLGRYRDDAIRFISARLYVESRHAAIDSDVVDTAAYGLAGRLQKSVCSDGEQIFAIQHGSKFESITQELPIGESFDLIRPLTFGLKSRDGIVSRKVLVAAHRSSRGGMT
jgi:hypothetical protein